MGAKRYLKTILKEIKHLLDEEDNQPVPEIPSIPFDNTYRWLGASFGKLTQDPLCSKRSQYVWGVLQGAALAKVLGMERISVIEFGVAGGAGLLALEHIAARCEEMVNIKIEVYGFDSGSGLPKPQDYRDCPNTYLEGQFPIDKEELAKRLRRAHLKLGLVKDTVLTFVQSSPPPVAFVSFDLDLYSSTKDALTLFDAEHHLLLPRIFCYFDDMLGETFSEYTGERLAISEFNTMNTMRKISPIYGLKYFVPPQYQGLIWQELFYLAHFFEHPLYNSPDAARKPIVLNIDGKYTKFTN